MDNNYNLSKLNMPIEELFSYEQRKDIQENNLSGYSYGKAVSKSFFEKRTNRIFLVILIFIFIFSFIYPLFSNYDRFANIMVSESKHLSAKSAIEKYGFNISWIFGTGANGESVFDSIWQGARISILLSLICGAINITVGVIIGTLWGYVKKIDNILLQVYYVIGNVPHILIVSVMMMLLSPSFLSMVISLTITGWLKIAMDIRNQVIIIRNREYNIASDCLGTPALTIIRKNILPHLISVIVTILSEEIPSYISYEVFLSYIGIGMKELSLGRLIYESEKSMFISGWLHEFWWPVAIVCIITISLYVLGQNLGDCTDPKNHR